MAEKDINADAKTEVHDSPTVAVSIDGYQEVSRGGSGALKAKKYAPYAPVLAGLIAGGAIWLSSSDVNATESVKETRKEAAVAAVAVGGIISAATKMSVSSENEKNTANYTDFITRGRE